MGYSVVGDGFRCCQWVEVDFVLDSWFCAVGLGGLRDGFLVDSSEGLTCGGSGWLAVGLWDGSR